MMRLLTRLPVAGPIATLAVADLPGRIMKRLLTRLAVARPAVTRMLAVLAVAATGAVVMLLPSPATAATCGSGYVALTYDDGPIGGSTTNLLNTLVANGVRATFFNIGQRAQQNVSLVQAQKNAGMWIGNHSWTHPHLTQMSSAQITSELTQTQQVLQQATGTAPRLFRPPYGETTATLRSIEAQLGLTEVLWSVDSQDWNGASTAQIVQAASTLQNGGVILMHDGFQTTVSAIPQIVANLSSRNLCAGMISTSTGRAVAPDGTPPTTPPPGGGSCTATYRETQRWSDRFNGEVTIRAGSAAISSWTATVTVRSPQKVSAVWNGSPTWDTSGNVMTVRPNGNGSLPPNGSTTFGFTVMANGTWTPPTVSCRTP
jgi:endo-1,4-beta-xylanase